MRGIRARRGAALSSANTPRACNEKESAGVDEEEEDKGAEEGG